MKYRILLRIQKSRQNFGRILFEHVEFQLLQLARLMGTGRGVTLLLPLLVISNKNYYLLLVKSNKYYYFYYFLLFVIYYIYYLLLLLLLLLFDVITYY